LHEKTYPNVPNGSITSLYVYIACALCNSVAGGSPNDMMISYCIEYTEVINSVWYVVDAISDTLHNESPIQLIMMNSKQLLKASTEYLIKALTVALGQLMQFTCGYTKLQAPTIMSGRTRLRKCLLWQQAYYAWNQLIVPSSL
jgi:hypothetical protein